MSDPSLELHVALLASLKTAVSCDVWDGVPQSADYPYVVIDTMTSNNNDFIAGSRLDYRFVFLTIWSRNHGQAEVLEIMSDIDVINEQPLTLTSGAVASLRVERKRTYREADNLTFQGQVTLRIITTH